MKFSNVLWIFWSRKQFSAIVPKPEVPNKINPSKIGMNLINDHPHSNLRFDILFVPADVVVLLRGNGILISRSGVNSSGNASCGEESFGIGANIDTAHRTTTDVCGTRASQTGGGLVDVVGPGRTHLLQQATEGERIEGAVTPDGIAFKVHQQLVESPKSLQCLDIAKLRFSSPRQLPGDYAGLPQVFDRLILAFQFNRVFDTQPSLGSPGASRNTEAFDSGELFGH